MPAIDIKHDSEDGVALNVVRLGTAWERAGGEEQQCEAPAQASRVRILPGDTAR